MGELRLAIPGQGSVQGFYPGGCRVPGRLGFYRVFRVVWLVLGFTGCVLAGNCCFRLGRFRFVFGRVWGCFLAWGLGAWGGLGLSLVFLLFVFLVCESFRSGGGGEGRGLALCPKALAPDALVDLLVFILLHHKLAKL